MKTKILGAMFGAMLMVSAIGGTAFAGHSHQNENGRGHVDDGSDRVTLCHKPDTKAEKTISVNANAEAGHLGHGDAVGECPVD